MEELKKQISGFVNAMDEAMPDFSTLENMTAEEEDATIEKFYSHSFEINFKDGNGNVISAVRLDNSAMAWEIISDLMVQLEEESDNL